MPTKTTYIPIINDLNAKIGKNQEKSENNIK